MKPFDLKKALAGHPLVTRDGREVSNFKKAKPCGGYSYGAVIHDRLRDMKETFTDTGQYCITAGESDWDLLLASPALSKPRPKSETRKNVERVRAIMGRNWITLADIESNLQRKFNVYLPEQSISARVRDLRKDEFGAYDIRKKQIGKGLFAYKNFGKKGVKAA